MIKARLRKTHSESEIFIHNRYEDTALLIYKEFIHNAQNKRVVQTAWGGELQEDNDKNDKEVPQTTASKLSVASNIDRGNSSRMTLEMETQNTVQSSFCTIV